MDLSQMEITPCMLFLINIQLKVTRTNKIVKGTKKSMLKSQVASTKKPSGPQTSANNATPFRHILNVASNPASNDTPFKQPQIHPQNSYVEGQSNIAPFKQPQFTHASTSRPSTHSATPFRQTQVISDPAHSHTPFKASIERPKPTYV